MTIFEQILIARGLTGSAADAFLSPDYAKEKADPYLLPDMDKAVHRLQQARVSQERIVIYGDYDVDGLSATALLLDAFASFGFTKVEAFIPNRFVEGYGLTMGAVDKLKAMRASLVVTVDCGSLSHAEIAYANSLGIDMIVTDHHNVADTPPPAIAAVNPRFPGHDYPFADLAGVGVAFKLVQALQRVLDGLPDGHEKWLLDLVALGTVCDIVRLQGENRANVYWGLEVMKRQRRTGLKALMTVAGIEKGQLSAKSLGFGLGPRLNAAGRLETAMHALEMLIAKDSDAALECAEYIDTLNTRRRDMQQAIFEQACEQAEQYIHDPVLVLSGKGWNHGVIGIVAAKILERYKKPVYIIEEQASGEAKGSARSYGEFSAADAIRAADDIIIKGGGHPAAAGVTLAVDKIGEFRTRVNEYYNSKKFTDQHKYLLPIADVTVSNLQHIDEQLISDIARLEPFGNANPEPIIQAKGMLIVGVRRMGDQGQHSKFKIEDPNGGTLELLRFNTPKEWQREVGDTVTVWFHPTINEWNNCRTIEGRLLHIE